MKVLFEASGDDAEQITLSETDGGLLLTVHDGGKICEIAITDTAGDRAIGVLTDAALASVRARRFEGKGGSRIGRSDVRGLLFYHATTSVTSRWGHKS